jgi:hypothetical protein
MFDGSLNRPWTTHLGNVCCSSDNGLSRVRLRGRQWADFVAKVGCNGFGRWAFR